MPREPKYRAACDQCSTTKTKCSGERPTCARCQLHGRDCHYSKSRRAGKPPRSRQLLNRRATSLQNASEQQPGRQLHPLATTTANTPILPNVSPPYISPRTSRMPSPYPKILPSEHLCPDTTEANSMPGFDLAVDLPPNGGSMLDAFGMLHTPRSHNESFDFGHPTACFEPCCMPVSPLDISGPNSLSGSPPAGAVMDNCFILATGTLNSLNSMQNTVGLQQCDGLPILDQVLQTCCLAMSNIEKLLACSCPKDFHLPILIGLLLSKVLAWYQAMIEMRDPHTELGRPVVQENVADHPLAFGGSVPDEGTRWAMKHQLVLRQLHKLSELVSRYHGTFGDLGSGGSTGEGGRLYDVLDSFLQTRILYTIQVVESRLGPAQ